MLRKPSRAWSCGVVFALVSCTPPAPPPRRPENRVLRATATSPAKPESPAVLLRLRVKNDIRADWEATTLQVRVDDRPVGSMRAATKNFAAWLAVEASVRVSAGASHRVELVADYGGRSRAFVGYRFSVKSEHTLTPEELGGKVLVATVRNLGKGPLPPAGQDPGVVWETIAESETVDAGAPRDGSADSPHPTERTGRPD
ncbi:MAG: hypothetical protein KC657_32385 [Myxococcales bacterium]|nr:hypothetical protein [Myxococcales bacterium]